MAAAEGNAPCRAWRRWPVRTIAGWVSRLSGRRSRDRRWSLNLARRAMEFLPCVFLLAAAAALVAFVVYGARRQERTKAALARVAERFHGQFVLVDGRECVRLSLEGHPAVLKFQRVGSDDDLHYHTQFIVDWPDAELRCEVYSDQFAGFRKLMRMDDVEIGSPRFDKEFVIKVNSSAAAQALLTPEAQEAISQLAAIPIELLNPVGLHGNIHVQWGGGRLTVTKPRSQWTYEALEDFVELSAELFVAALKPKPSGIEFVGAVKELDVAASQCQVCGEALAGDLVQCPSCRTLHHRECWDYFGGCSTYACGQRKYVRQS